jgi:hypothetical protein
MSRACLPRSPRRTPAVVAFVLAGLLGPGLAGCADIPTSGEPQSVKAQGGAPAQTEPEVRVIAQGPRDGDSPFAIVSGFLEASGTVEEGFATARKFLTPPGTVRWNPRADMTIYDQNNVRLEERGDRVILTTVPVGRVDDQGVFVAATDSRRISRTFQMARVGGEWRIDSLPNGLFVSQQDFEREYVQTDNYFIVRPPRTSVLVPDPVYTARANDTPTARIESLLRGPSRWLNAIAMTAAPPGAELAEPVNILSGVALVRLTPASVPIEGVERDLMLAQIVMTLTQDPEITQVEVRAVGQSALSIGDAGSTVLRRTDVTPYLPADLRPPVAPAYFVQDGTAYTAGAQITQGPFDPGVKLSEIAVSPGGLMLAGISEDRRTLWTAHADEPKRLTVRSRGEDIRSISFDGDGNLWAVEGTDTDTVVRRYPPSGDAVRVGVTGFEPRQITRLRVSADGARLALLLSTVEGSQVYLAQALESVTGLRIVALRRMAGVLHDPKSVDWADPGRLIIVATEPNAQPQPYSVSLAGPIDVLPILTGIVEMSAAPGAPMIATTSRKQIWRLNDGSSWVNEKVTGTAPTYPG